MSAERPPRPGAVPPWFVFTCGAAAGVVAAYLFPVCG